MDSENSFRCRDCGKPMASPELDNSENIPPNPQVEPPASVEASAKRGEHALSARQTAQPQESPKDQKPPYSVAVYKKAENKASNSTIHEVRLEPATAPSADGGRNAAKGPRNGVPVKLAPPLQDFKTAERMNAIINGEEEADDLTCASCQATLMDSMDNKIAECDQEIDDYKAHLIHLDERDAEDNVDIEELQAELARIEEEGRQLDVNFEALVVERDKVFQDRVVAFEELKDLEIEEGELERKEFLEVLREEEKLCAANEELISLQNRIEYAEEQLKLLKEINPLERMFNIDCMGPIGMINGFPLGGNSVSSKNEGLNVAWGETVRLLDLIANKFEFQFEKYALRPSGSLSCIKLIKEPKTKLPLYLPERGYFSLRAAFDEAQVAFLDCMWQLELRIQLKHDKTFKLINPISGFRICDGKSGCFYSIKKRQNTNASWTNALKCMLVNLKQILDFYLEETRREQLDELPPLEKFVE